MLAGVGVTHNKVEARVLGERTTNLSTDAGIETADYHRGETEQQDRVQQRDSEPNRANPRRQETVGVDADTHRAPNRLVTGFGYLRWTELTGDVAIGTDSLAHVAWTSESSSR